MITRPLSATTLGCFGNLVALMVAGGSLGTFGILFLPAILGAGTALTLVLALLFGWCLRVPGARRVWEHRPAWAAASLALGAALFLFGLWSTQAPPPLPPDTDPDEQEQGKLDPTTLPGLILAVLAVAHWPRRLQDH